ncbi:MAG: bifunctional nicotinamidase/pyrazinamidase [Bacillota bacterium]
MEKALLCVDLQNDFYEDGALPVESAGEINDEINRLLLLDDFKTIVASQDWHPAGHESFASTHGREPFSPYKGDMEGLGEVLWPDHCVQNTKGAEFHPGVKTKFFDLIIRKGNRVDVDSYSAFRDNDGTDLGLAGYLKSLNVKEITLVGLALDVCVFYTAVDARKFGFEVELILTGTMGVNASPGDEGEAITRMLEKGVNVKERYI